LPVLPLQVDRGGIGEALSAVQLVVQNNEKRRKILDKNALNHCLATSCIVERLFSRAKLIVTPNRRSMDPSTLENILMLKFNSDLYRATDIFDLKQNTATPNQQLEAQSPDYAIRPLDIAMSSFRSSHINSSSSHPQSLIAFGRGISWEWIISWSQIRVSPGPNEIWGIMISWSR
jgi:hypothetical protein